MIISIFLGHRKRLTPPNIEPRGGATKTGFRPVSAGLDEEMAVRIGTQKVDYGFNIVSSASGNFPDGYVSFTSPPTKQVVWRMYRGTWNMHAARANVLAALREKYGKETLALDNHNSPRMMAANDHAINNLWWFFDESGNRVPPPADLENSFGTCNGMTLGLNNMAGDAQPRIPADDNQMFTGWCKGYVILRVQIAVKSDPEIIEYSYTDLLDAPLAQRTARVYMAWMRDAAQRAHQADLDNAKKNKPVF